MRRSRVSLGSALAAVTRLSIRWPLFIVVAWLVVVAGCFAVGSGVFIRLQTDVGVVPGSESDRAHTLLRNAGPQPVELTAVVHRRSTTDATMRDAVAAAVADLRRIPGVAEATDPLSSTRSGEAALIRISLVPGAGVEESAGAVASGCAASTSPRWPWRAGH